ncbi:MAG: hypothetical protein NTU73_02410, partial [Ignavibacteriae bacterium]|nr:hypothetical protein [Ignavibacteriota bacterium]
MNDIFKFLIKRERRNLTIFNFFLLFLIFIFSEFTIRQNSLTGLIILIILAFFFFGNIIKLVIRYVKPEKNLIYKSLTKYGDSLKIAKEINDEFVNQNGLFIRKECIITKNWIIIFYIFNYKVINIKDVLWIYKYHDIRKVNFVEVSNNYYAVLNTIYSKKYHLKSKKIYIRSIEANVNKILEII